MLTLALLLAAAPPLTTTLTTLATPATPATATTTTVLTLEQAVARAQQAAEAKDGGDALEIEAKALEQGDFEFDPVRFEVQHRELDRFSAPVIDNNTNQPFTAADGVAVGLVVPLPRLEDLVQRTSAALRADAARAGLKENARAMAADARRIVVDIASLKRERELLALAIVTAQAREALLTARRASGAATILDVDEAARERLGLVADALGVDDDLQRARDRLSSLLDADVDADDDLDARCQAAIPDLGQSMQLAQSLDPKRDRLRLLDEALARDELAGWLGYLPWPTRIDALAINHDVGTQDNLRLSLTLNVPLLRFFDNDNDALALRRQANARDRAGLDARTSRQLVQADRAVAERRNMVALLALPPGATPEDAAVAGQIELHRNLAERRRLGAIARCALAVVDVLSLVSE